MPIIKRNPNKPNKSKSKSYFGGDDSNSDDNSDSDMDGGAGSDAGSNPGSNNAGSDYDENDGNDSEVDFMNVEQEAAAKKNKKAGLVDEDLGDDAGDNAGGEDIEDDDADADADPEDEEEEEDEEEDEDEQYIESDEEVAANNPKQTKMQGKRVKQVDVYSNEDEIEGDDDGDGGDDDDEPDENYLQKFSADINKNYITDFHPECIISNYDEVATLAVVVRDKSGIIIDDLHRTVPYLSKYERARILGQRAKQINAGAPAFVKVPEKVIDGYLIAEMELANKTIPFIIRRPLPNGGSEYWRVNDLENIGF